MVGQASCLSMLTFLFLPPMLAVPKKWAQQRGFKRLALSPNILDSWSFIRGMNRA